MPDEKCCKYCKYYHEDDEYWHDHYFIPKYRYCVYKSQYDKEEVEPDYCCENYESSRKRKNVKD